MPPVVNHILHLNWTSRDPASLSNLELGLNLGCSYPSKPREVSGKSEAIRISALVWNRCSKGPAFHFPPISEFQVCNALKGCPGTKSPHYTCVINICLALLQLSTGLVWMQTAELTHEKSRMDVASAAFQGITNRWQHREMPLVTTHHFAILFQMKKKQEEICIFAYGIYTIIQYMGGLFK